MKARVKATGEIVEINESSTIYDARMCHVYNASELENVPDTDPDYWTKLEHQYAGMAMQGMLANPAFWKMDWSNNDTLYVDLITMRACSHAHALVQKLKEKEERK